jgi:acyl carrier protein
MPEDLTGAGRTDPQLFAEVAGILLEVTGESAEWAAGITPNARLEVDLGMESIELIALGELLRRRYGAGVDLPGYVAGLDIDQIIGLSVGELVTYVGGRRAAAAAGSTRSGAAVADREPPPPAAPVMPSVTPVMPGQAVVERA